MNISARNGRTVLAAMVGFLVLTLAGCHESSTGGVVGSTVIHGSGVTAEESRSVSGFTGVSLAGIGKLHIRQGGTTSLDVRAEDNLIDYLETDVRGGTLVIRTRVGYDLRPTREIEYHVVVPDLQRVELSGAGEVHGSSIAGSRLVLVRSGVGQLEFSNLAVTALEATLSGVGSVRLDGTTQRQSIVLGGLGGYEAAALHSDEVDVTITGSGSATVWVSDRLDARIDGSGSVYYIGSPVVTRSGSGSGSVVPVGD